MKIKSFFVLILCIVLLASICLPNFSYADYVLDPDSYNPNDNKTESQKLDEISEGIVDAIQSVASIVSVLVLVIIGIMFMVGSAEEKASYKEKLLPYVIGAFLVFGISKFIDILKEIGGSLSDSSDLDSVGNLIVGVGSTIGSLVSVIVLIVIGIKYMTGSIDEKASYKKSLMPYVIGATLVFAASNIASIIYGLATA